MIGSRVGNVIVVSRAVVSRAVVSVMVVSRAVVSQAVGNVVVVSRAVVSRAERLVAFLAGPRLGWPGPGRRDVTTRSAGPKMLLETGVTRLEVVVSPVYCHQVLRHHPSPDVVHSSQ